MRSAIILAAGKGTRMKSELPKVMHPILSEPMVVHITTHLQRINVDQTIVVVGHKAEVVQDCLKTSVSYATQSEQLGTGHAVMQALPVLNDDGDTIILYGDVPCIQSETMDKIFEYNKDFDMTVYTAVLDDAKQYGRLVRDSYGNVKAIVEYKDCNDSEKLVNEINTGIYCVKNKALHQYMKEIKNDNAQKEFYLTDLVEIILSHNGKVQAIEIDDIDEVQGVNDRIDLAKAAKWIQMKINTNWMKEGVSFVDPNLSFISLNTKLGTDVTIYPNVYCEHTNTIGNNVTLLPNTYLSNSKIGNDVNIDASRITDSEVGNEVNIGPYAHLRMHCVIADKNRIGNFVEMKKTQFGYDSRCAHLTYLGDSIVGSKVNMGCGVVTVNYDGKNKFQTIIEDGAFIGSNANLIAPIKVGKNAVVAAGSTIYEDVNETDMAIARSRQINKEGLGLRYKEKNKK